MGSGGGRGEYQENNIVHVVEIVRNCSGSFQSDFVFCLLNFGSILYRVIEKDGRDLKPL